MPKFLKYLLIVSATFFSIFILFTSFNISSQSTMLGSSNFKSRKFYVKKEILPDHSLYPVLMAIDRFRLAMADRERRVYLLMAYANRRLFYATRLVDKEELALAITTFTKSQKYLNQALLEAKYLKEENILNSASEQLVFFVLEGANYHQQTLTDYLEYFTEADRAVLNSLSEETIVLKDQLAF